MPLIPTTGQRPKLLRGIAPSPAPAFHLRQAIRQFAAIDQVNEWREQNARALTIRKALTHSERLQLSLLLPVAVKQSPNCNSHA